MAGPLSGMRVIELAHIMSGPVCGMMLADMGAEVIKVEKIPHGDDSRRFSPMLDNGESASFMIVNRNKRGIGLNLKTEGARDVLRKLLESADVVTENYREGTMEKFGLGYDTLKTINPGLIYCCISGFGRTGPWASKGGFDLIAQGMSGMMSLTGEEGRPPVKAGSPVADINAGILAALGISAAYTHKLKTGEGQIVDTSLFEAALQQMYWPAASWFAQGALPKKMGSANTTSAPYQVFASKDGWINIGAANQSNYERLLSVLDMPQLAADPRFADNAGRMANRDELVRLLTERLMTRTTDEWIRAFDEVGLPAGPVLDVSQALEHPQAQARGMVVESHHPLAGDVKGIGLPIRFSNGNASQSGLAAPLLGQHTREVLREIGYADAQIDAMHESGTVFARAE
ncbi:CaiB/BaiF CoA-transferase family protein [Caballeronia sp. LZ034LL]|uniref:CaiB/BaiF CoA transferase family protein n=1 Tax=Caballeronia sp. LZ034LL TaxID=3038567 RepID=UPI002861341A|nr:CaiB/BaiF CoA-transferase family protein [Caballeronia sp. LZ034LL]MDR5835775.1 CaiB/BaiF CoA-transferase family protein [Caballeronia sp. LZ034LL]